VITDGMPGTGMPGWGSLPERERRAVVHYIKSFSERFKTEPQGTPIEVGRAPAASRESLDKGRQLYQDLECFTCHGREGRGDGPSALTLKDDWGNRIRPANLRKRWTFRGGGSVRAIYTRFNTGIAGTPMPAYADSIDAEQSWHLSNYVASLGPETPNYGSLLTAKLVRRDLPSSPTDPFWEQVPAVNFPLVGQVIVDPRNFTPSIDMVSVRVVYNEQAIAFLLAWDDPSPAPSASGEQNMPDALALQFPTRLLDGHERPYFLMGDPAQPVYLIRWRSDLERIEELAASGPGKIQPPPSGGTSRATGTAIYHEGQYRLMVTRPLAPSGDVGLRFERGRFTPIAFMAWDGANGESWSRMSVSAWYYLLLEEPTTARRLVYPPLAALATVAVEVLVARGMRRRGSREPVA